MNVKLKCIDVHSSESEFFTKGKMYFVHSESYVKNKEIWLTIVDDTGQVNLVTLRKDFNWQSRVWKSKFRLQLVPIVK